MTSPCYLCGSNTVLDGLCFECFKKENPLVLVKTPLSLLICKSCGAVKVPGGWKKLRVTSEMDKLTQEQIMVALENEVDRKGLGVEIEIIEKKVLDRVHFIDIIAKGHSHQSLPLHEESHPVEVRISYGTCDTCGLLSGGYHEAILQVRATDRRLTEREEDEIINLVTEMTVAEYDKDTKAYVTDFTRNKYGLDFKIGSEHLCHRIAKELETRYLAEKKENYKLVGQDRGGKRKYRSTILIRFPRFSVGDFVEIENQLCQILAMSKSGISCFNLIERDRFTVSPKSAKWRSLKFIADASEKREYTVISNVYGYPVQLMDTQSYEIHEIEDKPFKFDLPEGTVVYALLLEDRLHLLQQQEFTGE